jgi:hypothetical protein
MAQAMDVQIKIKMMAMILLVMSLLLVSDHGGHRFKDCPRSAWGEQCGEPQK